MKHKPFILLSSVLFLCLCLIGCVGVASASADVVKMSGLRSATIVGDTLYFLTGDELFALDDLNTNKRTILTDESLPDLSATEWLLTTDGEKLFLLEAHGRALYRLTEGKLEPVQPWLDAYRQRTEETQEETWYDLRWRDAVIIGEKLFALAHSPAYDRPAKLLVGSLMDGKLEEAASLSANWLFLARGRNDRLIAYESNLKQVMALDAARGTQKPVITQTEMTAFCSDDRQDALLTLQDSEVRLWKDGKSETLGFFEFPAETELLFFGCRNGRPIAVCADGLYLLGAQKPEHVITLLGNEDIFHQQDALVAYNASHPLFPAVYRCLPDADMEAKLHESVSAQDDQADFFVLSSYSLDFAKICARGFAAPIESEKLRRDVQSMTPQIRDWVTRDGQLYAFPVNLHMDFQILHSEGWAAAGLGDPPTTVRDYTAAAARWFQMEREGQNGFFFVCDPDLRSMLRYGCLQYAVARREANLPLTFQTPEFLSWMEQWISLQPALQKQYAWDKPEDAVYLIDSTFIMPSMQTPGVRSSERMSTYPYPCQVLPFPSWEGKARRYSPATLYVLVLNPYGKHQKEAVAFLEYLSEHLPSRLMYELHPDLNEMKLSALFQAEADSLTAELRQLEELAAKLEAKNTEAPLAWEELADWNGAKERIPLLREQIEKLQESAWEYTPYELQCYRAATEHMLIDLPLLPWNELTTVLEQALYGKISAQQAVSAIDHKVRMAELESR